MADWIHFDHHVRPPAKAKWVEALVKSEISRSLGHTQGDQKPLEEIAKNFGLPEHQAYLTKGHTESIFSLLYSHYTDFVRETGRTHIILPDSETGPISTWTKHLEKFEVTAKRLPVDAQGHLTGKTLEQEVRARTGLLSLSLADPHTGVIQPISDLIRICRRHDILIHCDVSAALGKISFEFCDLDVDFLTFNGRILNLPDGYSGLLCDRKTLSPTLKSFLPKGIGGAEVLSDAFLHASEQIDHYAMTVASLRNTLEEKISDLGARLFFQEVDRLPNVTTFAFAGIAGELLQFHLERRGLLISTGDGALAKALMSTGVDPFIAHSSVSIALSPDTTQQEIDSAADLIEQVILDLKPLGAQIDVE